MNQKDTAIELSIVIPCLNEVETVATCVKKAGSWIRSSGVNAEVIVADNGSTDGSVELAEREGARVVPVAAKGYGSALMKGIAAARGKYVVMGDADDSYDFSHLEGFIQALRAGNDLAQGCRLPSGGGRVTPGAMPPLHRWLGNPLFSVLARIWFGAPIHDVYCGLRGFSKAFYEQLDMQCTGMEFAVEMVIKAALARAKFAEVPIILYPDGRQTRRPHLRTFRDGWRTLRFFLLFSPRWLFLYPGLAAMLVGTVATLVLLPGTVFIGKVGFDVHTLFFCAALIIIGFNAAAFAVLSRVFAASTGLLPERSSLDWVNRSGILEKGLTLAGLAFLIGLAIAGSSFYLWSRTGFGELHSFLYVRLVICSVTLLVLGAQLASAVFFLGIINLQRRTA